MLPKVKKKVKKTTNVENYNRKLTKNDRWAIHAKAVLVKGKLWKYAVEQVSLKGGH